MANDLPNDLLCRFVEWLHRRCSGKRDEVDPAPPALREASHSLNNEVMILHTQINRVKASAETLANVVDNIEGGRA